VDRKKFVTRAKSIWRLSGLLLVLGTAFDTQAEPPSSSWLPGRKPDSTEPWGTFLGRAAHLAIGRQYRAQNPSSLVFLDPSNLSTIVRDGKLGDSKRLAESARLLRPDITDTRALVMFEIKPDNEDGRRQGREQVGRYLTALNEAIGPGKKISGGIGYEGSLFLDFENGGALWRLAWRTPEPGVTLYRWSYRRKKPNATWKERAAQKEEELPQEEIDKHGEWAEQALRATYEQGELPSHFPGQVYLPVDCH